MSNEKLDRKIKIQFGNVSTIHLIITGGKWAVNHFYYNLLWRKIGSYDLKGIGVKLRAKENIILKRLKQRTY